MARRALSDLLAYRRACGPVLSGQNVWGLGVVWGEGLPAAQREVRLVTFDELPGALAAVTGCDLDGPIVASTVPPG